MMSTLWKRMGCDNYNSPFQLSPGVDKGQAFITELFL